MSGSPDSWQGSAVIVRDPQAVSRDIAGERIIVPVRGSVADLQAVYTLNEIGGWIWDQVDGSRTEREIVDALVAEFQVERDRATEDVARLIDDLCAERLLRRETAP